MIRDNTVVSMRYRMKNGRGDMLEESRTTYLQGSTAISRRLQSQLEGLVPGESRTVYLKKGENQADDDFIFDVTITAVRVATAEEQRRGVPLPVIKIHLLSGFLGSGKTTAILQACRYLDKNGIATAVITNDQGSRLVDGELFTYLGFPSGQVTDGCFCCNYNELDAAIRYLLKQTTETVVFAESVGSCTDLVATVLKPLLQQHPEWQSTVTVFADAQLLTGCSGRFDETINYIYNKQLEEARVIVVSKADLVDTTQLEAQLQSRYPGKIILYQNSFDEEGIARWLQTLDNTPFTQDLPSLDIDYDIYGAGEAKLAWLDQQLEIESKANRAQDAALAFIHRLGQARYPIGHLKFLLDGQTKISITATGTGDEPRSRPATSSTLLINARIQTDPSLLSQLVADAIQSIEEEYHCSIRTLDVRCFQPGYPRPTHRVS
jgi:Ni2+-binding GTPase involved in maturation of urease and hydrogenase